MTSVSVPREKIAHFLNTTPDAAATYALIGDGVTSLDVSMNPKTVEEQYIHESVGVTEIVGYQPNATVEASAKFGDSVFDFVDGLRNDQAIGEDAKTDIVEVFLYKTEVTGTWPALKWNVSIQVDSGPGGAAGELAKLNYTINFNSSPTKGMFNPSTKAFTPDA